MMRILNPAALFPLLAIAFISILFLGIYDDDARQNKRRANLLLELKELDGRLDREILLITSLRQQNYDDVTRTSLQINRITANLIQPEAGFYGQLNGTIDDKLSAYHKAIEHKIREAERIKTMAAVVRNGLNYLPQLIEDMRQSSREEHDQIVAITNRLYRHYIFHSSLDADDISAEIDQLTNVPEIESELLFFINNLNLHIRSNLQAQQTLLKLRADYLAIPSATAFSELLSTYQHYRETEIQRGERFSMLLIAVCALLLFGLGSLIRKLERSHQATENARARLRDGVESLNEAFALFDHTGALVLCNEQFTQFYPWLKDSLAPGIHRDTLSALIQPHIDQEQTAPPDDPNNTHKLETLHDGRCFLSSETPTAEGGEVWVRIDITHSRDNELELRKRSRALEQSPVSVVITDINGTIEYINPKAEEISGYSHDEVIGANPRIFRSGHHSEEDYQQMWQCLRSGQEWQGIFRNRRKNGELYWEAATISSIRNDADQITHYVAVKDDISTRKQAEDELRMNAAVFETTSEGILITDAKSRIISVNPAFTRITGYSLDEVRGKTPRLLRSERQSESFYKEMWHCLTTQGQWSGEIWNKRKDESIYPQWLSVSVIKNSQGQVQQYVAVFTDITQRKQQEHQIQQQANYDALTKLPNRSMLKRKLQKALFNARSGMSQCALLFVDLDRFKAVNDTMGHAVGDELLQQVAFRLAEQTKVADTIARIGGDEFIILLEDIDSEKSAASTAQRIIDSLRSPFRLFGREIYIGASIGIALFPADAAEADVLLRHADMAMYKAKERGRNQYQFFNAEMRDQVKNRTELEQALRLAINNNEFELYYQPIINSETGRVESLEALVRWHHPKRGMVSPAEFIPLAEETGLIQQLGVWVFEHSCRQLKTWQTQGIRNIAVAINISSSQRHLGFNAERARQLIEETGVNPGDLVLEITESMLLDGSSEAITWLNELKALGIQLAIDDFGTGYSSLSYLKRFPIDKLKIDRAFINDLSEDEDDASLVKAIIAMSHSMGLTLVAEGVETQEQLDYLRSLRCDLIQGYFYSRPLPAEQIPEMIDNLEYRQREASAAQCDFII